jgi:hypothetical protein
MTNATPFEETLDNGLLFRTLRDENDIVRYVDFNTQYNNPNEGLNTNCLIRHFPGASYADYQLIEDQQSGEIVSTTCLIPWILDYEGISLRAGQLEQVLSRPDYRRHGLVKLQIRRFMQVVRERQLDVSFIWGIPFYYRQYGYTYCLDGNAFELLPTACIPDAPAGQPTLYSLRSATIADITPLTDIYNNARRPLQFSVLRSSEHWRYLLEWAQLPIQMVIDQRSGQALGYLATQKQTSSGSTHILESGLASQEVALAVLQLLKTQRGGDLKVCWPQNSTLARLARLFGSITQTAGQWLFHITDIAGFLTRIGPVLEKRLAVSDCAGITTILTVNLFRQAYCLYFTSGKLTGVESLGFVDSSMGADGGDLLIPPEAFVRLVFGYRGLDQLFDAWPDIVIKPTVRRLVEVLFPHMDSYLYSTYAYFGGE